MMAQWRSQTRKMNNHYQSAKKTEPQGNDYVNKDYNLFPLGGFRVGDLSYTFPYGMGFKWYKHIADYTGINGNGSIYTVPFDFNKMNPYIEVCKTCDDKLVYMGVYDYDTDNLEPIPIQLQSKGDYLLQLGPGHSYKIAEGSGLRTRCLIPVIHRVPIVFAWTLPGYQDQLPSWLSKKDPSGEFPPHPGQFNPLKLYTELNDSTLLAMTRGLLEAIKLYPSAFPTSVKIPFKKGTYEKFGYVSPSLNSDFGGSTYEINGFINNGDYLPSSPQAELQAWPEIENQFIFEGQCEYYQGAITGWGMNPKDDIITESGQIYTPGIDMSGTVSGYSRRPNIIREPLYYYSDSNKNTITVDDFVPAYQSAYFPTHQFNYNLIFKRLFDGDTQVGAIYFSVCNVFTEIKLMDTVFAIRV